jgi:hypothetical protein
MLGATVEAMLIVLINLFRHEARPVAIEKKLKLEDLLRWDFGKRFGAVQRAILVQRFVYFQSAAMPTKSSIHASGRVKQALELNETVH